MPNKKSLFKRKDESLNQNRSIPSTAKNYQCCGQLFFQHQHPIIENRNQLHSNHAVEKGYHRLIFLIYHYFSIIHRVQLLPANSLEHVYSSMSQFRFFLLSNSPSPQSSFSASLKTRAMKRASDASTARFLLVSTMPLIIVSTRYLSGKIRCPNLIS